MNDNKVKNLKVSSGSSFNTETRNMHQLKSQMKLPLEDMESYCLYHDNESSWVSTEVDYTVPIRDKPTKIKLESM